MSMSNTARVVGIGAAGAVGAAALHCAPYMSMIGPLRRHWLPHLAGIGNPSSVALTFDDGPDPASTPLFMDELERLGMRATFFLLGDMVRRSPLLASELVRRGHEVALHGDVHRSHLLRSPLAVYDDMQRSHDLIANIIGRPLAFFRPPFGSLSTASLWAARRLELRTVLWSTWGRDWRAEATPMSVMNDIRVHLDPGATLLLHDSDCTSAPGAWKSALGALPQLADELSQRQLRAVALSEHMACFA